MQLASLREMAKQAALVGLGSSILVDRRLERIRRSGAVTILNLHRVAPDDQSTYPPLDPRLFEYLLPFLKRHFAPVTFATAADEVGGTRPRSSFRSTTPIATSSRSPSPCSTSTASS